MWTISKNSNAKIWFYCENKDYHEYCTNAYTYVKGCRCKYCTRTKHVHPKDSLGQYIIDNFGEEFIDKIWSSKNLKSPFKYTINSEEKVWFNCHNQIHEPKLRQIKNVVRGDFNCSYCMENNNTSKLQKRVFNYINSMAYKINTECKCTLIPINPKSKVKMPFDNEIEELKLIIEVHGRQHYKLMSKNNKWLHGDSPEQYLYYRKLKDRYKKLIAYLKGYEYLEIPYWCDDNKESWKKLINEKINNIKKGTTTERIDCIL